MEELFEEITKLKEELKNPEKNDISSDLKLSLLRAEVFMLLHKIEEKLK